jgi:uncharacterized repeat protein (TIGR01451 family)
MMNAHTTPRLFRAAAVAIFGFAMTCGLLILMGGLALPVRAAPMADTVISSDIITDTTWTVAGSPYIISGTVNVYSGTLSVNPNVTVRFNRYSELVIQGSGRMVAIGTANQPITFTSNVIPTPASCDWNTIRFNGSNNIVRYSTIEYAAWGIDVSEVSNGNDISYNLFRSNGLCVSSPVGGAIVGSPDNSTVTYNTFTNNASAIYVAKASGNIIAYNTVSGTTQAAIAFAQSGGGATRSSDNQIYSNTIRGSQGVGLLIDLGSYNTISQNLIYNNLGNGVWLADDRDGQMLSNQIYGNAAGLYMTGTQNARLADNFIHDNVVNYGLDYGPNNSGTNMTGNAICRDPSFELRSQVAALIAAGNWWGTNNPASEISGTLNYTPSIQLALTPTNSSILANGAATTTLNVTFNDGASHVVPASARGITVTASAGTLSAGAVTVDGSGLASLVLTSSTTPRAAVITATDSCGYAVTTTVVFAGYVDLGVDKTASPGPYSPIPPDNLITYTISYSNAGNTTATGVVLTETLPASTTFAGRPSGWTQVGTTNQYTRAVGSLAPASGTLATTFVVTIASDLPAGDFSFVNTVQIGDDGASGPDVYLPNNTDVLTLTGGSLPDLWVVKNDNEGAGALSGPLVGALANTPGGPAILELAHALGDIGAQQVPEGGLITYTIGYGNSDRGVGTASGVVLSETLPLYTTFVGPTGPDGWTAVGGRVYTYFVGGLDNGQGDYVYFTVRVDSSLPSTVTEVVNTVCIRGAQNDLIPSNDCSNEQTPIITGTYDLSVSKVENATCLNPGDALGYQIAVSNLGANSAGNVILREMLPANTTFIGLPGSGWTDIGGGVYTYSLGTVPSGATSMAVFGVQINPGLGPSVTAITNTVSVQADGSDSNPANNSFTLVTPIGTTPDLVISKNDNTSDQVRPGNDVITYTIGYLNNSNRYTATNVIITDTLPPGTIITGSSASLWRQVDSSNNYTFSVGTLGPNEFGSLELTVQVTQTNPYPYGSEVVNQVQIRGTEAECDLSDNFATEETPVEGANAADLAVTKADNVPFCAVPGDVIAYTIAYTNNSYSVAADNVVLTETIDTAAVTFLGPTGATGWSGGGATYTHTVTSPLATRASGTTVFDVQVAPSIGQDYITNVVRIGTTSPDWDITNNVFTLSTYVPPWPDLIVIKNDNIGSLEMSAQSEMDDLLARLHFSPEAEALLQSSLHRGEVGAMAEFINPGGIITYTVILGNIGREGASNVVLTETLPPGTTFLGPGYWHHVGSTIPNNTYTYTVGALDAGIGDVLQFIVRVDNPFLAGSRVLNTVQIGGSESECNTANNTSNEETPVQGAGFAKYMHLPVIIKSYPVAPPTPTPRPPTPTPPPAPLAWVSDVAVDIASNRVFVAGPRQDSVYVIEGGPDVYTASVPVGHGPTGLAVLASTTPSKILAVHAYALNSWNPALWFIDASTLASHSMADGYLGAAPSKVAVNSITNRAFASNYWDLLPIVDPLSETLLTWVQKKNFLAPYGVDVSQRSNLVYMATIDTGELIIFDAAQAESNPSYGACHHAPPEPRILRMVAFNESTGHLFVTSPPDRNKGQTNSQVLVLDEDMLLAETGGHPSDLTCDWNFLQGSGDVGIQAIPGPAWIRTVELPGATSAGEEGITVNPVTGRVYVTDGPANKLFVVQDSATPTNISLMTTVANVGDYPQGVGVNPTTNKVYVANARNAGAPYGTVSVVNGATNIVTKTINLGP